MQFCNQIPDLKIIFARTSTQEEIKQAFDVLGLEYNTTLEEYKKKIRELFLKYHPDKHINSSIEEQTKSEEIMKRINPAAELVEDYIKNNDLNNFDDIYTLYEENENEDEFNPFTNPLRPGETSEQRMDEKRSWYSSFYNDFDQFLEEIQNNPFYDNLDEKSDYEQENIYVDWQTQQENQQIYDKEEKLLAHPKNKLPTPEEAALEESIKRYNSIVYSLGRNIENIERGRSYNDIPMPENIISWLTTGSIQKSDSLGEKMTEELFSGYLLDLGITKEHPRMNSYYYAYKNKNGEEGAKEYVKQIKEKFQEIFSSWVKQSITLEKGNLKINPINIPEKPSRKIINKKIQDFAQNQSILEYIHLVLSKFNENNPMSSYQKKDGIIDELEREIKNPNEKKMNEIKQKIINSWMNINPSDGMDVDGYRTMTEYNFAQGNESLLYTSYVLDHTMNQEREIELSNISIKIYEIRDRKKISNKEANELFRIIKKYLTKPKELR